ncbi:MAG: LemA family protein [Oligoflexales bacterium]|nr:LemA family protein [Oligoflexales bacterium]
MNRTLEIIKSVYGTEKENTNRKARDFVDDLLKKTRSVKISQGGFEKIVKNPISNKVIIGFVLFIALIPVYLVPIYFYNKFYTLYDGVLAGESVVDTVLEKRYNLTVNLTRIVMDYGEHENRIFGNVIASRGRVPGRDFQERLDEIKKSFEGGKNTAKGDISSGIFALAEQYPDLKLSQNYQKFSDALVDTEKEIALARQKYVEKVDLYNVAIRTFPGCFLNLFFRFKEKPMFKTTDVSRSFNPIGH